MKRSKWIPLIVSIFLFMLSMTALAFDDISQEEGRDAILELYNKGLVTGVSKTNFAPQRSLSYAEAVTLYVKAFDLNLDHIKFVKAPVASDLYDNIKNEAWHANSFVVAYHNGATFPRDLDPMAAMSREKFAHFLYQILSSKVKISMPMVWNAYADLDKVNEEYQSSINALLTLKIANLNKENQFLPKKAISRAEAAVMLYNTLERFGDQFKENMIVKPKLPIHQADVQVYTEKVNEEVNKVTIDWGEKGSTGYSVTIDRIEFTNDVATIYYSLHYPDPKKYYAMVITYPKASTYVAAGYKIETMQSNYYTLPYERPAIEIPITKPNTK